MPSLELDTIDTSQRIYDYACPGGVVPHDTIGMEECDIVVSAETLATLHDVAVIEVYPNPVKDQFQVRLPEFIALRNSNKGLSTALYQSNYQQQSTLQVFDLSGRFITEQKLKQGQLIAEFDASNWVPGMYLLRLVYKNKTVGSAKVIEAKGSKFKGERKSCLHRFARAFKCSRVPQKYKGSRVQGFPAEEAGLRPEERRATQRFKGLKVGM